MRMRSWPLTALFLALFLALACGRTGLGTAQHVAGGAHGPGGGDTGGTTANTGGAAGVTAGPCGEATCLSSLFESCVPAGSCAWHGGGGPDAVASDTCYANGVTVHHYGGWNGTNVTGELTVSRRGTLCYTIESISGAVSSATTYVVSGPGGEVATAVTADKTGSISVTCQGHAPVLVSYACLDPVSTDTADCTLDACP